MKKYSLMLLVPLIALLLSSCSMHLGLSKILKPGSGSAQPTKTKHIKATHTPPSPPTGTPAGAGLLTPTPAAANTNPIAGASVQLNNLQGKVNNPLTGVTVSNVAYSAPPF